MSARPSVKHPTWARALESLEPRLVLSTVSAIIPPNPVSDVPVITVTAPADLRGGRLSASSLNQGILAGAAPLAAPTNLTAEPGAGKVVLFWSADLANVQGFNIERSVDGINFTSLASVNYNVTSFADAASAVGQTYYYRVSAYNAAGNSPVSNVASSMNAIVGDANLDGRVSGADYTIFADHYGAVDATWTTGDFSGDGKVTGADYTIWADNYGKTAPGVTIASAPAAPTGVSFSNITTSSLTLNWSDAGNNDTGIHVYRSTDGTNYSLIASLPPSTTFLSDANLTSGTQYYYIVGAYNIAGETQAVAMAATQVAVPAAPTGLSFSNVTVSSLTLNWNDAGNNDTGVHVYRSTNGTNFGLIASLPPTTTTISDTGLAGNTRYYYIVGAYNAAGETQSVVASTITQVAAPAAPTGLSFSNVTTSTLTLKWNDAGNNDTGIHVYRSTDGTNYTLIASVPPTTTSISDAGLASGTMYDYIVGAYNAAGETQSAVATVTTQSLQVTAFTLTTLNMTSFTELDVVATSANDTLRISQSGGVLTITDNGQTKSIANSFGDLKLYGAGGNDSLTVDSSVNIATLIYGGDGNDTIVNNTSGKATIVTIGNGLNTVTGNGINTSFWVNPGDTVNASATEIANGAVNRVAAFYQPFTTNPANPNYIPLNLYGQNLPDPTDSGSETRLAHSSFWGTGAVDADVNQGNLNDCYFIAPLASLAYSETLKFMNTGVDLGDGTYAIRFTRGGVASYVRVDGDLPAGGYGPGVAYSYPGATGNQWTPLYEKAYAYYRNAANTYASLSWGFQGSAYSDVGFKCTSIGAGSSDTTILNTINNALSAGKALAANTNGTIVGGAPLIGSHVYTIIAAWRDGNGTVQIEVRNPWGVDGAGNDGNPNDGLVTISYSVFAANFGYLTYTTS